MEGETKTEGGGTKTVEGETKTEGGGTKTEGGGGYKKIYVKPMESRRSRRRRSLVIH